MESVEIIELSNLPESYDLNTVIGALCSTIGLKIADVAYTISENEDQKNFLQIYLNREIDGKIRGILILTMKSSCGVIKFLNKQLLKTKFG